jgi:hypothetical protein
MQIVRFEQDNRRSRHGMPVHPEFSVTERLHPRTHVVLHKNTAIAASLIPVGGQPIAILQ